MGRKDSEIAEDRGDDGKVDFNLNALHLPRVTSLLPTYIHTSQGHMTSIRYGL